jgi:thioredoxin reductase (NADPH)
MANKESKMKNKIGSEEYDFIVIGAGVTGLAASMYAARLELKTLCLGTNSGSELPVGGVITTTDIVENYPGFIKLTGEELAGKIKEHALAYDKVSIKEEKVIDIRKKDNLFVVKSESGEYVGKAILFATGTRWRKLEVSGSKEFEGRGIFYCALCDSPFYKNKITGVVGGSDSAAKDALVLAEHAKKVYIIYRKEQLRAEPINIKKIKEKGNIEIINNTNVVEIKGDSRIRKVVLDKDYNGKKELELDGLLVDIGHLAISELAAKIGVELNEKKEIIIDHKTSETNMNGVYAAGDVADKPFKQAITGVAEGCTAAYSAFEYIKENFVN